MTAPPRPQWLGVVEVEAGCECAFCKAKRYIEHLERYIEQLEATQREATWRPDMESDLD